MPCIKCANGKWKYGKHGKCVFDTLEACHAAEAAIHIQEQDKSQKSEKECVGCGGCDKAIEIMSMDDVFNQANRKDKF